MYNVCLQRAEDNADLLFVADRDFSQGGLKFPNEFLEFLSVQIWSMVDLEFCKTSKDLHEQNIDQTNVTVLKNVKNFSSHIGVG